MALNNQDQQDPYAGYIPVGMLPPDPSQPVSQPGGLSYSGPSANLSGIKAFSSNMPAPLSSPTLGSAQAPSSITSGAGGVLPAASSASTPSASTPSASTPSASTPSASTPKPGNEAGLSGGSTPNPGGIEAFDDGGVIPDPGDAIPADPQDPGAMQNTLSSAVNTAQQALAFGRKQAGLPHPLLAGDTGTGGNGSPLTSNSPTWDSVDKGAVAGAMQNDQAARTNFPSGQSIGQQQQEDAQDLDDDLTQPKQQQGYDDGGDVGNPSNEGMPPQPAPPTQGQGQTPPKLVGYATGAGAVSPDVAAAMEQKVDPQGTMDPAARKLMAISAAGNPQQQFGLMQQYRQKFNATTAFARAAAQGTPQKPADLAASAKAATQAFQNVPNGTSVAFTPSQNGVTAHVKDLAPRKGATKGYDDGGSVQTATDDDDNEMQGANTPLPAPTSPASDTPTVETTPQATGDQAVDLSNPAYLRMLGGEGGGFDGLMDLHPLDFLKKLVALSAPPQAGAQAGTQQPAGAQAGAQQPAGAQAGAQQPAGAPPAGAAPQAITGMPPDVSNPGQTNFNRYLPGQKDGPSIPGVSASPPATRNPIDPDILATAKQMSGMGYNGDQVRKYITDEMGNRSTKAQNIELQELKNKGMREMWGVRGNTSTANNERTNEARTSVATINAGQRALTAQQSQLISLVRASIAQDPTAITDPNKQQVLMQQIAATAAKFNIDPREVVRQAVQPQQTQPRGQLSAQDQTALSWATSHSTDPRAAQIKQRLGM